MNNIQEQWAKLNGPIVKGNRHNKEVAFVAEKGREFSSKEDFLANTTPFDTDNPEGIKSVADWAEKQGMFGSELYREPEFPEQLPPMVELMLKELPRQWWPIAVKGMLPLLSLRLSGIRLAGFNSIMGPQPPTLFTLVVGPQSCGKSTVMSRLKSILVSDLTQSDLQADQRMFEYREYMNNAKKRGRRKKGEEEQTPRTAPRERRYIVMPNQTGAAVFKTLYEAGGHQICIVADELEDVLATMDSNKSTSFDALLRQCFYDELVGQDRATKDGITFRGPGRISLYANSTPLLLRDYFSKRLGKGLDSRILFALMPRMEIEEAEVGVLSDEEIVQIQSLLREIKETGDHLPETNAMNVVIPNLVLPMASEAIRKFLDEASQEKKRLEKADQAACGAVLTDLVRRSAEIGFRSAISWYFLNGQKEDENTTALALWIARSALASTFSLFGEDLIESAQKNEITYPQPTDFTAAYMTLPEEFSYDELCNAIKECHVNTDPPKVVSRWVTKKRVSCIEKGKKWKKT